MRRRERRKARIWAMVRGTFKFMVLVMVGLYLIRPEHAEAMGIGQLRQEVLKILLQERVPRLSATPANGEVPVYNSTTGLYDPGAGGGGGNVGDGNAANDLAYWDGDSWEPIPDSEVSYSSANKRLQVSTDSGGEANLNLVGGETPYVAAGDDPGALGDAFLSRLGPALWAMGASAGGSDGSLALGDLTASDMVTGSNYSSTIAVISTLYGIPLTGAQVRTIDVGASLTGLGTDIVEVDDTTLSASISRSVTIVLTNTAGGSADLFFSSSWKWSGSAPASIAQGATALLTIWSTSNAETGVIASYELLGTGGGDPADLLELTMQASPVAGEAGKFFLYAMDNGEGTAVLALAGPDGTAHLYPGGSILDVLGSNPGSSGVLRAGSLSADGNPATVVSDKYHTSTAAITTLYAIPFDEHAWRTIDVGSSLTGQGTNIIEVDDATLPSGVAVSITIDLTNTAGGTANLFFSTSWSWSGTMPTSIAQGARGLLTLTATTSSESGIVASYELLGDGT